MRPHVAGILDSLAPEVRDRMDTLVRSVVKAKERGRGVVVCTGSGPNIHEGVTTLIAELIRTGVVDGVLTSSAVISHEMAGSLERVKRVSGVSLGFDPGMLAMDGGFEVSLARDEILEEIEQEMPVDRGLVDHARSLPGDVIIKAAGNLAYPTGLRAEALARDSVDVARSIGLPLETVLGFGADERTMIGAAARRGVPVLVTVPQLVGGGSVGLSLADAVSVTERCSRIAALLDSADVIVESAVALTQEIHDGPFETWTGHGIWAAWTGRRTYSLRDKVLARMDLDTNLERAWQCQRESHIVQDAIAKGLPKTKVTGIPFRMEMSGFARLETSLPLVGDIGALWPAAASLVAEALGLELAFVSAPQETPEGKEMRDWIVDNVTMVCRRTMMDAVRKTAS